MAEPQKREVERLVSAPFLNKRAIELITKLCFREENFFQRVDFIFLFGVSRPEESIAMLKHLLKKIAAKKVMLTGGIPNFTDKSQIEGISQSEKMLQMLEPEKFPEVVFYTEKTSSNTLENVEHGLQIHDFSQYNHVMFICLSWHAGRAFLTLKKFLPSTTLVQFTYETINRHTGTKLTRENWSESEAGRSTIFGEYKRIVLYGERGDIYFSKNEKLLIDNIAAELLQ